MDDDWVKRVKTQTRFVMGILAFALIVWVWILWQVLRPPQSPIVELDEPLIGHPEGLGKAVVTYRRIAWVERFPADLSVGCTSRACVVCWHHYMVSNQDDGHEILCHDVAVAK